ncbi:MAG: hypothetical protein HC836_04135 [Richelia sp. RM2_1_2]|nr:hypothetical protein [Richelia sp. RM1_1_1]NJO26343.1 hypothetical protein [Richelia sp. SL_2_1]NJO57591.1 hypothetical protein [Richelia sp. RM2_1_2]
MKNRTKYSKRSNRSVTKRLILIIVTIFVSIILIAYPTCTELSKASIVYATEAVEQVVDISIKTTTSSVDEYHPRRIYILIKNKFDQDILVMEVLPIGPDFIDFIYSINERTILPGQTQIITIDIKAKNQVQPGKHLLLFNISFKSKYSAKIVNIVSTQEINVGVIGESEIIKLLGLPSLLVLPGFLMLVAVKIFWESSKTKDKKKSFPLKTISPEFWFIAITLSLPMIFLYPIITERFLKIRRNYLETYGLTDIILVWLSSIFIAAASYFIVLGSINLFSLYKIWRIKQDTPSPKDDPITILYKLDKQGLGVSLESANLKGIEQTVFLLEFLKDAKEEFWVAPPIILEWLKGSECKTLRENVLKQLNLQGNAKTLANLLKEGEGMNALRVDWPLGTKPMQVKSKDITKNFAKQIFVQEK